MPSTPPRRLEDVEILVGATYWALNGVNVFSANLVRGLLARGLDAKVLLTEEGTEWVSPTEGSMPRPEGIPFTQLPVHRLAGWGAHWGAMIRYLEAKAPCIWLPNSDYRHSAICPRLSDDVMVVGVVHSDDPLHYDHAARLGAYWNWATATSPAIARRVLASDDALRGRLTTIPIGVDIPETPTSRPEAGDGPIRLIYHGALKKYQKRILDLVGIVRRCLDRDVPVELTIAGTGDDEDELREAARELVDAGAIRFLGVVPHHEIFALLEQHDVYLLTSEFEGMPNAMLEAMGRGCVPVVTRMESGIPDLVADGENGFLVPVGDLDAFADRIATLAADPERRRRMALAAHARVRDGAYRQETMVDGYVEVFERVLAERASGAWRRPAGRISPPPNSLDGVSVFPLELTYDVPDVGPFPRWADARDFRQQLEGGAGSEPTDAPVPRPSADGRRLQKALASMEVVVGLRTWTEDGLCDWALDLSRGLRERGVASRILVTEGRTDLVQNDDPPRDVPGDVPVDPLPVAREAPWGAHWGALVAYLERRGRPCVYLPNDDYRHSGVVPLLAPHVLVVGALHGDDPLHHHHVARLGRWWNAVVAGNDTIAEKVESAHPELGSRLVTIPYSVPIPPEAPEREGGAAGALRLLWIGPGGPPAASLERAAQAGVRVDVTSARLDAPRGEMRDLMAAHDAFVMVRPTYGDILRLRLGMGLGCVPVLLEPENAFAMPVSSGVDGYILDDDPAALGAVLAELGSDPERRARTARTAHASVWKGSFRTEDLIDAYEALFERIVADWLDGSFRRPPGPMLPPPAQVGDVRLFPVELGWERPGVGRFVDQREARHFARALPFAHRLRRRMGLWWLPWR